MENEECIENEEETEAVVIRLFSSPTLDTVQMVEKTIEKYNGEFRKTQLWEKLPKKVMWGTYLRILNYLQEINKIITSNKGIITYIWDKKRAERYMKKRGLRYERTKGKSHHPQIKVKTKKSFS